MPKKEKESEDKLDEESEEDLEEILEDLEIDETNFNFQDNFNPNPSLRKIAIASEPSLSLEIKTARETQDMNFSNEKGNDFNYIPKQEEGEKKYLSYESNNFSEKVLPMDLNRFSELKHESPQAINFRPTAQPNFSDNSLSSYELPKNLEEDSSLSKSQRDFLDGQKINREKYKSY